MTRTTLTRQVRLQQGDARGAVAAFERALGADPFNATAAYNLSLALTRAGRADEGRQMLARFQTLRQSGAARTLGNGYLQQGRYAEALVSTGAEPDLVSPGTPDVQFLEEISGGPRGRAGDTAQASATDRKSLADAIGGGLTAIDVDDDGDLDLLEIAPDHERFWRNDGRGRFRATPAPAFEARPRGAMGIAAVAGDVDNDGRTDLFVVRHRGTALYRFAHAADEGLLAHVVLEPLDAALRWRGFSREWKGGSGWPLLYAYGDVSSVSPWKRLIGAYTAEGPVRAMLEARDDRFVIAGPGDEITVAFDASRDAPSPPGRTRTFLFHADGFSKEMDLHSASPDTVLPLPFHAMERYPPATRHSAGG
ncbi:MAG: hypothetical protein A3K13_13395 [Gemmatimonadetes bacterium RIFCSPLOWO2_12_FULL_68_9]|nr:MAG: hypothetical protein A3K13_13395 [Gemmatimonadetes bacterium RIFCSPLOWO2_12_FULL_68_9]